MYDEKNNVNYAVCTEEGAKTLPCEPLLEGRPRPNSARGSWLRPRWLERRRACVPGDARGPQRRASVHRRSRSFVEGRAPPDERLRAGLRREGVDRRRDRALHAARRPRRAKPHRKSASPSPTSPSSRPTGSAGGWGSGTCSRLTARASPIARIGCSRCSPMPPAARTRRGGCPTKAPASTSARSPETSTCRRRRSSSSLPRASTGSSSRGRVSRPTAPGRSPFAKRAGPRSSGRPMGQSVPSEGSVWVNAADGTVLRTSIRMKGFGRGQRGTAAGRRVVHTRRRARHVAARAS